MQHLGIIYDFRPITEGFTLFYMFCTYSHTYGVYKFHTEKATLSWNQTLDLLILRQLTT